MNRTQTVIKQDFYNQKEEVLQQLANEFSEGNIYLENTLLNLWKNDIKTQGCCNGHNDKESFPYINILIDNSNLYKINNIIKYFMEYNEEINITFCQNTNNLWVTINMKEDIEEEKKNQIFKIIGQLANKEDEQIDDTLTNMILLAKVIKENNLTMKYNIDKEENTIAITKPFQLFNNEGQDIPYLKDALIALKENAKLSLGIYKCNEEDIKEFVHLFYPNIHYNTNTRR